MPVAVGARLPSGGPFTQEMADNASTIVGVGQQMKVEPQAHVIATAPLWSSRGCAT